jgi:hypothetical protein
MRIRSLTSRGSLKADQVYDVHPNQAEQLVKEGVACYEVPDTPKPQPPTIEPVAPPPPVERPSYTPIFDEP